MNWSDDAQRQIFLIGDAPPHLDYRDNPTPDGLIQDARARRIVVNTIGCRSLPKEGISFFRRVAYATEGSYQHIGRVRSGEAGLADAMLRALDEEGPAARRNGEQLRLRLSSSDDTVRGAGILVRHGLPSSRAAGSCRISVLLPEGVGVRGTPRATFYDDGLDVELRISQGAGGSRTYRLERCIPDTVPIRVTFGG
jgi:hypothetical protein